MSETTHIPSYKKLNLAWALFVTVAISAVLVLISFAIFLKSGAYDTVRQISAAEDVLQTTLDDIDTTSPIQASDLEEYSKGLPQRIKTLNDTEDFSQISL